MFIAEDMRDHNRKVALKKVHTAAFMEDEVRTRTEHELEEQHVLKVLRVHVPRDKIEHFGESRWAKGQSSDASEAGGMLDEEGTGDGEYVVVLPWAKASLNQVGVWNN